MIHQEQLHMVHFIWCSLRNNCLWTTSSDDPYATFTHGPFRQEILHMVHFVLWSFRNNRTRSISSDDPPGTITYGPFHFLVPSEQSHMVHFVAGWWQSRYDKIYHKVAWTHCVGLTVFFAVFIMSCLYFTIIDLYVAPAKANVWHRDIHMSTRPVDITYVIIS